MKLIIPIALLWTLSEANASAGSRVLVIFPVPSSSHSILGNSVVKILLDAGYQVTYVSPFPMETNHTGLTVADISSILIDHSDTNRLDIANLLSDPKPSHWVLQMGHIFAKQALQHAAVQELLNDHDLTFDAVIADWFYSGLLAPLAAVYDCPLIWYSTGDVSWQSLRVVHEASSAALSVDPQASRAPAPPLQTGDKVHQILTQMYLTGWTYYYTSQVDVPVYREVYSAALLLRGRRVPPYEALVHNASLLLVNCHPPLGQHLPLPRNVQYVGGHHLSAAPMPLPKDLKRILDESKLGVVYFNLGSNLKSKDLSEDMKRGLLEVFGQLQQTVLWKFEDDLEHLPGNVHLVQWAPQESILAHPNVLVFITHSGLLSITEATQHGVPLVGVPIFGDQFVNIDQAVHRGCGIRVDFSNDLPMKIQKAVNEILDNPSYHENAKQASWVFRQRLAPPRQALVHWVRLVLDTRGAEHLQPPTRRMSTFAWLNLDVLVIIVIIVWFLSKVVKVIQVHLKDSDTTDDLKEKNE